MNIQETKKQHLTKTKNKCKVKNVIFAKLRNKNIQKYHIIMSLNFFYAKVKNAKIRLYVFN